MFGAPVVVEVDEVEVELRERSYSVEDTERPFTRREKSVGARWDRPRGFLLHLLGQRYH